MKTALVLCPKWDAAYPVYALALLSAALKERGHETEIFDLNLEMSASPPLGQGSAFAPQINAINNWADAKYVEELVVPSSRDYLDAAVERILSRGSRVVGFSVYFSNAAMSLQLARLLKRRDPRVLVVFGGPNCLSFEGCLGFLAHDDVDAVVFGEGDRALPELVASFEKTGRPQASSGVLVRETRSSWIERQDPVEDLDALPFADYSGFRLAGYKGKTIHSCRGCVRRCVFCSDWREMSYRQMGGDRIYREIAHQLEKDPRVNSFLFGDSIINSSIKSMSDFCGRMTGESISSSWGGFAIVRPELDSGFLARMRAAGCSWLTFGIESGSESVLRNIGKHVEPALNARVLADASRAGIDTEATWLVGFPTETDESFEESMAFLRAQAKSIKGLFPSLFSIQTMRDSAARFGFTVDHDLYWRGCGGRNTFPVRVERMRRLIKEAGALGIVAKFEDKFDAATIDACCDALLVSYAGWRSGGARAGAPL